MATNSGSQPRRLGIRSWNGIVLKIATSKRQSGDSRCKYAYHTNGKKLLIGALAVSLQGKAPGRYGRIEASISSPSLQVSGMRFWMLGDTPVALTDRLQPPVSRYDTMAGNWPSIGKSIF